MYGKNFNRVLFIVLFCFISVNSLFFELDDHERCYVDELFADNVVMINYRFYDLDEKDPETKRILDSIIIKIIHSETDHVVSQHNVRRPSGKHSTTITQNSHYKICVQKVHYFDRKLRVRLIIDSDNMDEPDLSKAVKHEDVNQAQETIQKIIKKGMSIIQAQKLDIDQEDTYSNLHIQYSKRFILITIVQIVLILGLGIYNIFSFRNFLISKNLI